MRGGGGLCICACHLGVRALPEYGGTIPQGEGGGGSRNVGHLERRNLVRRKFGANSSIPLYHLVQKAQIVAQERAYTANIGFWMVAVIS